MSTKRTFLTNSLWPIFAQCLNVGLNFVVTILLANFLGATDFGILAFSFALAALAVAVGQLGLDGLVVREMARQPSEANALLGTTLALRSVGYLIGSILLVIVGLGMTAGGGNEGATERIVIVIAAIYVMLMPLQSVNPWYQANLRNDYIALANTLSRLLAAGFKILCVVWGLNVIAVAYGNLLQIVIAGLFLLFIYTTRFQQNPFKWRFRPPLARRLISESGWILLATALATIYVHVDQVMIRAFHSAAAVAPYAVAASFIALPYFVPIAITNAIFPTLIKSHKSDRDQFIRELKNIFFFYALVGYALMIFIALAGYLLIPYLFPEDFRLAKIYIFVMSGTVPLMTLLFLITRYTLIENVTHLTIWIHGVGAAANVVLNLLLIPTYGALGAAVATLISYSAAVLLGPFASPKLAEVRKASRDALLKPYKGFTQIRSLWSINLHGKTS